MIVTLSSHSVIHHHFRIEGHKRGWKPASTVFLSMRWAYHGHGPGQVREHRATKSSTRTQSVRRRPFMCMPWNGFSTNGGVLFFRAKKLFSCRVSKCPTGRRVLVCVYCGVKPSHGPLHASYDTTGIFAGCHIVVQPALLTCRRNIQNPSNTIAQYDPQHVPLHLDKHGCEMW